MKRQPRGIILAISGLGAIHFALASLLWASTVFTAYKVGDHFILAVRDSVLAMLLVSASSLLLR